MSRKKLKNVSDSIGWSYRKDKFFINIPAVSDFEEKSKFIKSIPVSGWYFDPKARKYYLPLETSAYLVLYFRTFKPFISPDATERIKDYLKKLRLNKEEKKLEEAKK